MGRAIVYILTVGLVALLAFLTLRVLFDDGLTPVVGIALVIVVVLVLGALGAVGDKGEKRP